MATFGTSTDEPLTVNSIHSKYDITHTTNSINDANKALCSQALIIQAYCKSVCEQPMLDLTGMHSIWKYQTQFNDGLLTAQTHANNYLNVIQPAILTSIANMSNYYALNNTIATSLPALTAFENQSKVYQNECNGVVKQLQTLKHHLITDSGNFSIMVIKLNAAVQTDNAVLISVRNQLSTIQDKIDATNLAMGIAGIVGKLALELVLSNLRDEKAKLLTQETELKSEVKIAAVISSAYDSITNQVNNSVSPSTWMAVAWKYLYEDLESMTMDLKRGITMPNELRYIFLSAAGNKMKDVIQDIQRIKEQMGSVKTLGEQS